MTTQCTAMKMLFQVYGAQCANHQATMSSETHLANI